MTPEEIEERGFSTDEFGKVLDEFGNDYLSENGSVVYVKTDEDTPLDKWLASEISVAEVAEELRKRKPANYTADDILSVLEELYGFATALTGEFK